MTEPGHPTAQGLADAVVGAPGGDPAALEHLASCTECQRDAAALAQVSAELAALGPVALPGDLAARIDTALASTALASTALTSTALADTAPVDVGAVVPLDSRRSRPPRWLAAAAAVAVVAAGVTTALVVTRGSDSPTSTGDLSAAAAAPSVDHSGFDYSAENLSAAISGLLVQREPGSGAAGGERSSADSAAPESATSGAGVAPKSLALADTRQRDALTDPALLAACLVRALGPDSGELRAVDLATFNGAPAVIAAFAAPDKPGRIDVYALDPACPEGAFLYFARVTAPTPR